jgi:hypothetical protein
LIFFVGLFNGIVVFFVGLSNGIDVFFFTGDLLSGIELFFDMDVFGESKLLSLFVLLASFVFRLVLALCFAKFDLI